MTNETHIRTVPADPFVSTGSAPQEAAAELRERAQSSREAAADLPDGDGIRLLLEQHARIRDLLAEVTEATGAARQQPFDELRELLARHETAEEMVLRPVTRTMPNGQEVAEARTEEENSGKRLLSRLEELGVDAPEFSEVFAELRMSIQLHANAEEKLEFAELRVHKRDAQLGGMGTALAAAERGAPTHPHPAAKTTAANYVAGPFAAMLDRARDAIGKVTG